MSKPIRVIISGGGTGGHIFPAVSIADELRRKHPDASILFVGAEGRMEMQRVPKAGYDIVGLPVSGLVRPLWSPKNVGVMMDFLKSRRKAKKIIREFRPDVVVGVGGYASSATLNAAHALGLPAWCRNRIHTPALRTRAWPTRLGASAWPTRAWSASSPRRKSC